MATDSNVAIENNDSLRGKRWVYLILTVVLVGAAVLTIYFINSSFGDGQTLIHLSFLTPQVLAGLVMLLVLYFVFDVLRLRYILLTLGFDCNFTYLLRLSFINVYVSAITPLATGGGFCQLYFLSKKGIPLGSATAATSIRTLLAVLYFLILVPILLFINPNLLRALEGGYEWILILSGIFYTIILVCLILISVFEKGVRRQILRLLMCMEKARIIKRKRLCRVYKTIARELRNFNAGIRSFLRGTKKTLCLSLIYTFLFLMMLFSFTFILMRAMGYTMPAIEIYQIQVLVNFLMYFALTPGATGIAEGSLAVLMRAYVSGADITSLVLVWRSFSVYLGTFIGMFFFYMEIYKLSRRKQVKHG